jgi:hypothetical protein
MFGHNRFRGPMVQSFYYPKCEDAVVFQPNAEKNQIKNEEIMLITGIHNRGHPAGLQKNAATLKK